MSRSNRKNKVFGNTCKTSEKKYKTNANKKLRRLVKVRIANHYQTLPLQKEGKHYWADAQKKDLSK